MSDVDFHAAANELSKMANFARAFEGAKDVIEAVLVAEQRLSELSVAIEARGRELADAGQALAVAQDKAMKAEKSVEDMLAAARANADDIVAKARETARQVTGDAQSSVAALETRKKELERQVAEVKGEANKAREELAAVEAKLTAARAAVADIFKSESREPGDE